MSRVTGKGERVRRTPINGKRNVLTVQGKEAGYMYRIVNDEGDRISQFQEQGYELVTDSSVKVGDRRISSPTQEGSPIQISVGGGQTAYVMRIKQDWYDEDQAAKQVQVNELEQGIKKEAQSFANYGKLEIK